MDNFIILYLIKIGDSTRRKRRNLNSRDTVIRRTSNGRIVFYVNWRGQLQINPSSWCFQSEKLNWTRKGENGKHYCIRYAHKIISKYFEISIHGWENCLDNITSHMTQSAFVYQQPFHHLHTWQRWPFPVINNSCMNVIDILYILKLQNYWLDI